MFFAKLCETPNFATTFRQEVDKEFWRVGVQAVSLDEAESRPDFPRELSASIHAFFSIPSHYCKRASAWANGLRGREIGNWLWFTRRAAPQARFCGLCGTRSWMHPIRTATSPRKPHHLVSALSAHLPTKKAALSIEVPHLQQLPVADALVAFGWSDSAK